MSTDTDERTGRDRRSALSTSDTELKNIAAAAKAGESVQPVTKYRTPSSRHAPATARAIDGDPSKGRCRRMRHVRRMQRRGMNHGVGAAQRLPERLPIHHVRDCVGHQCGCPVKAVHLVPAQQSHRHGRNFP